MGNNRNIGINFRKELLLVVPDRGIKERKRRAKQNNKIFGLSEFDAHY